MYKFSSLPASPLETREVPRHGTIQPPPRQHCHKERRHLVLHMRQVDAFSNRKRLFFVLCVFVCVVEGEE